MRANGYTIDGGGHVFDQDDGSHLGHLTDLIMSGRLERL